MRKKKIKLAAHITRILKKLAWTAEDLGIIEVTNMAVTFKQSREGLPQEPLITGEELKTKISQVLKTPKDRYIYRGFGAIHSWLKLNYNIALGTLEQVKLQIGELGEYIYFAKAEEDFRQFYVEQLPAIMSKAEYKKAFDKGHRLLLEDSSGKPKEFDLFFLICTVISYYVGLLKERPEQDNPLKAFMDKYQKELVESSYIKLRYNEAAKNGFYIYEDGRRSDQLTEKERAEIEENMFPDLKPINKLPKDKQEAAKEQLLWEYRMRVKREALLKGITLEEAYNREAPKHINFPKKTWHLYEYPPEDLNKWEVLEEGLFQKIYVGMEQANIERSYSDFYKEYKELAEVILADIQAKYGEGLGEVAAIPCKEWASTTFTGEQLYSINFFGFKDIMDAASLDHIERAKRNGVAIIDQEEDFQEPELLELTPPDPVPVHSLQLFFPENELSKYLIEENRHNHEVIRSGLYFLKAYNMVVDLTANVFRIPDIEVLKMDLTNLEARLRLLNIAASDVYGEIQKANYKNKSLQEKKLKVLHEYFKVVEFEDVQLEEEAQAKALELMPNFEGFRAGPDRLYNEVLIPPEYREV